MQEIIREKRKALIQNLRQLPIRNVSSSCSVDAENELRAVEGRHFAAWDAYYRSMGEYCASFALYPRSAVHVSHAVPSGANIRSLNLKGSIQGWIQTYLNPKTG